MITTCYIVGDKIFEGKLERFYTCWMCIMQEFFTALDRKVVQYVCSEKDAIKILVYKDQFGAWQFKMDESDGQNR